MNSNAKQEDIKSFWHNYDSFQGKVKMRLNSRKIRKKKYDQKVKKTKEKCPYCSKNYRSNQIKKHKKKCL